MAVLAGAVGRLMVSTAAAETEVRIDLKGENHGPETLAYLQQPLLPCAATRVFSGRLMCTYVDMVYDLCTANQSMPQRLGCHCY